MKFTQKANAFENLPEGHYTMEVVSVEDKPEFDKVNVKLRTSTGRSQMMFFNLVKSNGEPNNMALAALTSMWCGATGRDPQYDDGAETQDMIGGKFECDLVVRKSESPDGRVFENINLRNIEHVSAPGESDADDLLSNL